MAKCPEGFHPSPQTGQDGPKALLFTNSPMVTIDLQMYEQNSIHQIQGPANNRHNWSLVNQNERKCYNADPVGDPMSGGMQAEVTVVWTQAKNQMV